MTPTESTILAEIEAIAALAERNRLLAAETPVCTLCRPDDPCWWHRPVAIRATPSE